MVLVAIRPAGHTLLGFRATSEFSVSFPSVSQVREVDFCGLKSGANADRVERRRFILFYGTLKNAPLTAECPSDRECLLVQIVEFDSPCLALGRVVATHVSEHCVSAVGSPEFMRVNPAVFPGNPKRKYCSIGPVEAQHSGWASNSRTSGRLQLESFQADLAVSRPLRILQGMFAGLIYSRSWSTMPFCRL